MAYARPSRSRRTSVPSTAATGCDTYRVITAAIDFGTSNSGYAFQYSDDPMGRILTNDWRISKGTTTTTAKAPTTVLFESNKTFHSFGYDAEEKYARLCDKKQQTGWRYFRRFKMLLYKTKKLNMDTEIYDSENKPMPAIDIFVAVIRNLKEHLLNAIRLEKENVKDDDILFVITVPAIWSDAAKQFMREASNRAGIENEQLKLALEPEAASVMCSQLKPCRQETGERVTFTNFPVGHKYIVADLGGGTADIATHEVIENGRLHEIYNALGNGLGSTRFDDEFIDFLTDLFGNSLFEEWKTTKQSDYLELLRKIEALKWSLSTSDEDLILHIPHTLCMKSMKANKETLNVEDRLQQKTYKNHVNASIEDGTIELQTEFAVTFFNKTVDGVKEIIERIVTDESISGIKTIVIVGGLSKSAYVRDCIGKAFPGLKILVPKDSGLSVMKGAVLLGNKPQTIAGRIARYTYGIGVSTSFIKGTHREDYRFTFDGDVCCNNVFDTIIKKGTIMKYGQRFTTSSESKACMPETKQQTFTIYLYQSIEDHPKYTQDDGCTKIGGFDLKPPQGGWPDYVENIVEIIVGEAEFQFRMKNDKGDERELKVDFLLSN